ncbi:cell wall-binding repeat-containing protein [Leifsonia sp. NPDC058248]|uniref:cell wall-binding repeat-containing protein n=1 Tax=Leifsonia sp. NPDC058248 TaxID=3346402 RepID=UPI0036DC5EBC
MLLRPARTRLLAALLTTIAVVLGSATIAAPADAEPAASAVRASVGGPAKAAVASGFNPGYIISDYNFFNGSVLDTGTIQSFLNNQVPTCRAGFTCLKSYTEKTVSRAADAMCAAYTGGAVESAATIIFKVGRACGISQKVLLVLLQKEQSLVTDDSPSANQYRSATGYACPDTAPCDALYYGFYNQVYKAAWQYKRYSNPPGTGNTFTWFPVGKATAIRYSPVMTCAAPSVVIQNAATAALYYYTPYQPNPAALANLYGTGDACSAYGNRNFWRIYTDWFGSTTRSVPPIGSFDTAVLSATAFTVSGWAIDQSLMQKSITVSVSLNTPAGVTTKSMVASGSRPDVGNVYPSAGAAHGFSVSIPRNGANGQFMACVTAVATTGNSAGNAGFGCKTVFYSPSLLGSPPVSRFQGGDRFSTSVAVSRATYPASGVPVAFIASGTKFADALSAGPAAAAQGGPLLLVAPNALPSTIAAELTRLAPKKIVIVGGPAAVSDGVAAKLRAIQPNVQRLAGSNRFATSRAVASAVFGASTAAYVASGFNFPDALSATAAAGAAKRPILLVDNRAASIDPSTAAYLKSSRIRSVAIVGGPAVMPVTLEASIAKAGSTPSRFGGSNRYNTSHLVNMAAFTSAPAVYLATGLSFPDALSGASAAGVMSSPLFVIPGTCLPRTIGNDIVTLGAKKVILLGGPAALSVSVNDLRPC